jgi:ABC-type multidrug transport system fused ATPase/permease subunit
MQMPMSFYQDRLKEHKIQVDRFNRQLVWLSTLRVLLFLFIVFALYYNFSTWPVALGIGLVGGGLFLWMLSRYTDIKSKRELHKRLVAINENEIKIANGDFHHQPDGKAYMDSEHAFSLDVDMFGRGSFFQFINRATIKEGELTLKDLLLSNTIDGIEQRQEAIKELSKHPEWLQHYAAVGKGIATEHEAKSIILWLKNYRPFLKPYHYWGSLGFICCSVIVFALAITETIPLNSVVYWLIVGLGLTGLHLKRINILAQNTQKAKDTFRQYALLLEQIETKTFEADLLKLYQDNIAYNGLKASQIFKNFSKALDALDNRNNLISAVFGNGYLLWDIRQSYRIEQWIGTYAAKVEDWFDAVTFFDAFNTLGNFAFNHQDYTYPTIAHDAVVLQCKDLGHPLLRKDKRVSSDVTIEKGQFFIVTGANMAGKSTFLRTVALHNIMANTGLPVCATKSHYTPIKLITSMRTTDSLTDDSSYFFSELTRLKFVVDTLMKSSNYFVILDEILKGTNSKDKAIGSRKFVEKLVAIKATGIIATHDLSLTEIENQLDPVKNYFFDAEIKNDELFFDYKLKRGVCKNMNASFLLNKMDII